MAPEREPPEENVVAERRPVHLTNHRKYTVYTRIKHGFKVPRKHSKGGEKASDDDERYKQSAGILPGCTQK